MNKQKKTILFSNAERDIGFEIAWRVGEMLKKQGKQIAFCPTFDDDMTARVMPPGYTPSTLEQELPHAEMIITFGGDGTILRAARASSDMSVPILGVNLGGKGFMAELESEELSSIDAVASGGYWTESRMMLDVEVMRGSDMIYRDYALNDIVIRGENKVIDLMIFGDGHLITHFSGDGAVIATPTGSTAYSMAAGGPIVEEAAHNIIVTPVCAHVLQAKSFVLVSDRRVSVELGYRKNNPAYMSVDGENHQSIQTGDIIYIHKSERCTSLVRLSNRNFYKKVSEKLGERP